MNEIKSKVLTCLKIIWTFLLKKKPKDIYSTANNYMVAAHYFAPIMINTLIYLGAMRGGAGTFEQLMQNGHINSIVKTSIDVLCLLSCQSDFQISIFVPNGYKMFMQIVIPYLRISEKEKDDIENDPREFVNYSVDICQKQTSKTYKTQAAMLLEHIVDHIDGMLTFVVDFTLEVMQNIFTG